MENRLEEDSFCSLSRGGPIRGGLTIVVGTARDVEDNRGFRPLRDKEVTQMFVSRRRAVQKVNKHGRTYSLQYAIPITRRTYTPSSRYRNETRCYPSSRKRRAPDTETPSSRYRKSTIPVIPKRRAPDTETQCYSMCILLRYRNAVFSAESCSRAVSASGSSLLAKVCGFGVGEFAPAD